MSKSENRLWKFLVGVRERSSRFDFHFSTLVFSAWQARLRAVSYRLDRFEV
jgi:hypothetical protein